MIMKIYRHSIFPSIISEIQCETYNEVKTDMLTWIYEYSLHNTGICVSNRGGWHSTSDMHHQASFDKIKTYIEEHISVGLLMYNCNFKIDAMWININQKGNYNACHDHPGSILSGVFWVKSSDNCGKLTFHSKSSFMEYELIKNIDDDIAKSFNYYEEFEFTPIEGSLVIFPAHLMHDVEPNDSDEDRISISFNLNICD
jgi:uncharacterized protein (TIGR02466 family)